MSEELKLYEEGLENFSIPGIIVGNIIFFAGVALGVIAIWFYSPTVAWVFLAYALAVVLVLRKLVCTNCYYYGKWCPIGWGKLSALLYKPGKLENFGKSTGVKLAPLAYGLLAIVPLIFIIISLVRDFTILKLSILVLLLAYGAYSGSIGRKKACVRCKMRLICPGCAVKN